MLISGLEYDASYMYDWQATHEQCYWVGDLPMVAFITSKDSYSKCHCSRRLSICGVLYEGDVSNVNHMALVQQYFQCKTFSACVHVCTCMLP